MNESEAWDSDRQVSYPGLLHIGIGWSLAHNFRVTGQNFPPSQDVLLKELVASFLVEMLLPYVVNLWRIVKIFISFQEN